MTSAEIKNIIAKHNRYSSDAMRTAYDSGMAALIRYKTYIDEDALISLILEQTRIDAKEAPDMFSRVNGGFNLTYEVEEDKNLPILYKHLTYMVENVKDIRGYALQFYGYKHKKYNDMIYDLLKTSLLPLIQYIQSELNDRLTLQEEQEKRESDVKVVNNYGGDHYQDSVVQKDNQQASMNNVGNDNSKKTFHFQKESFFLGIVASVISGLIVWGITALIQYLVG